MAENTGSISFDFDGKSKKIQWTGPKKVNFKKSISSNDVYHGPAGPPGEQGPTSSGNILQPPALRLDRYNRFLVHFDNRPTGATVVMYKYTHKKEGAHVRGYKNGYFALVAPPNNQDLNALSTTMDGYTFVDPDDLNKYILLMFQSDSGQNGIYKIDSFNAGVPSLSGPILRNMAVKVLNGTNVGTWLSPDGNGVFDTVANLGATQYTDHLGRRWKMVADLGAIDEFNIWDFWQALNINIDQVASSGQYYFVYSQDNTEGIPSQNIYLSKLPNVGKQLTL